MALLLWVVCLCINHPGQSCVSQPNPTRAHHGGHLLHHARGHDPRARVAIARKLAVILHRISADGNEFRWGKQATASVTA